MQKKNPPKTKTHRDNTCHKCITTWVLKLLYLINVCIKWFYHYEKGADISQREKNLTVYNSKKNY